MAEAQHRLFDVAPTLPAGFEYRPHLISEEAERALLSDLVRLPFEPFEFHGYLGKRRVVYFGHRYDFGGGGLGAAPELPPFLLPVRERAAAFAGLEPGELPHVLVTEYQPGAGIGWHRDRPEFGKVIGVSFAAACVLRLRRREGPGGGAPRSRWRRDPPTCWTTRPAPNGSTASPPEPRSDIR